MQLLTHYILLKKFFLVGLVYGRLLTTLNMVDQKISSLMVLFVMV